MIGHTSKDDMPAVLIQLDNLNLNPGRFCMSFGFDIGPLACSIKKAGLINRPIVTIRENGNVEIVTGYRRILALKKLGVKSVICLDISGSDKTDLDLLLINIHDNRFARNLNIVEKSMALNRAVRFRTGENEYDQELLSLLEIHRKELLIIKRIESLPDTVKSLLADNSVSFKAFEVLSDTCDEESVNACIKAISKLKLNYNQQLHLIEYTSDLSSITRRSFTDVLSDMTLQDIINDPGKNIPQKAKEFINTLREQRFPDLSGYEKIFNRKVGALQLPGNIKISHPQYFESEGFQLQINFKSGNELKNDLKYLISKKELGYIGNPWESDDSKNEI